ncbi:NAD-dependent epimerase/dehydratase family protein [Paracraurococcus lichenis]|uniref:NAD(P)-dependent oxidoreductase n=1 Tax=Paracraurococcus lichenis TaxID=3064888 RepID=A0ABT9DZT7_9PROT|nr:NAD(P)-dependent oxidoreductase [Paracraurococcus sp. LOR1-02]MDO9709400.1 NAD(P)-dependent oxidoreductase [Paracraurococcus sp. LOR1-02]
MRSVVVTGGSGKAGTAIVRELLAHGYAVLNVDVRPPAEPPPSGGPPCHFMRVDLTGFGSAVESLARMAGTLDRRRDPLGKPFAVVHMAGIPAPGLATDAATFHNNMMTTWNIFSAATLAGVERVVWASSETTYGLPLTRSPPLFAPVTEDHPLVPESSYALAKALCERMAEEMHRWNPGTRFTALRISNILEEADYALIPGFQADAALRRWNLWSWVDARDVAQAARLALEADVAGCDAFTIAAADTVMERPSRDLMAEHFPGVPIRGELAEHGTLLSVEKAKRVLGYAPRHSWRR